MQPMPKKCIQCTKRTVKGKGKIRNRKHRTPTRLFILCKKTSENQTHSQSSILSIRHYHPSSNALFGVLFFCTESTFPLGCSVHCIQVVCSCIELSSLCSYCHYMATTIALCACFPNTSTVVGGLQFINLETMFDKMRCCTETDIM